MLPPEAITLREAEPIRMLPIEVSWPLAREPEARVLPLTAQPASSSPLLCPSPVFSSPFQHALRLACKCPVGLLPPAFQTQSPRATCLFQKWNCIPFLSPLFARVNGTSQRSAAENWTY